MSEDRDKEFWVSLERRISDLDGKTSQLARDYQRDVTQLTHEVKEVTNRVNLGLANSVHGIENEHVKMKLAHSEQAHAFDKAIGEMRSVVREHTDLTKLMNGNLEKRMDDKLAEFQKNVIKPVSDDMSQIKKMFIYGTLSGFIAFGTYKMANFTYDKIFKKDVSVTATK